MCQQISTEANKYQQTFVHINKCRLPPATPPPHQKEIVGESTSIPSIHFVTSPFSFAANRPSNDGKPS